MTDNLTFGKIYKGSDAQISFELFPRCVEGDAVTVWLYTTDAEYSIRKSYEDGSLVVDGNIGTCVLQRVELDAFDDGLLKFHIAYMDGDMGIEADKETRWYIKTPIPYTPINFVTDENVETIVRAECAEVIPEMMDGYATEEWVNEQGFLTEHQDISGKVDRTEIADMATKTWVEGKGYLTQHQDISGKVDRTEITDMATKTWVEGKGYLTQHQQLKTINNQSIIGSGNIEIQGGSGSTYTAGANIDISQNNVISVTGITSYTGITSSDVTSALGYTPLSEHQSLDGYATENWVENKGYLTQHQDISGKQDVLVSGTNIKTINNQSILGSGNIEIQGGSGTTYTAGTNIDITNNVISVTGITVPTKVSELENDEGYLTEHQDISGKQDVLVSGTNIKNINGMPIMGSGNIAIGVGWDGLTGGDSIVINNDHTINLTTTPDGKIAQIERRILDNEGET